MAPQTPHPTGESHAGPSSTASVVLLHRRPGKPAHYDWLIEIPHRSDEHRLMSFRSPIRPDEVECDIPFHLDQTPDHRAHYLEYEGEIAGDGGVVTRVALGRCSAFEVGTNPKSLFVVIDWGDWGDGEYARYQGAENERNKWVFHRR